MYYFIGIFSVRRSEANTSFSNPDDQISVDVTTKSTYGVIHNI